MASCGAAVSGRLSLSNKLLRRKIAVGIPKHQPGHYLQTALAREFHAATPLSDLIDNAAYSEGWARYGEGLAEEARIYDTVEAAILRRLWPARGMVVDPGLHAFHWTREHAIQ